jgi:hypothetical protein
MKSFIAQNGIGGAFVATAHQIPVSDLLANIGLDFAVDALLGVGAAILCTLF